MSAPKHTVGLWRNLGLSRLERVKAHRDEFGSSLKDAVEAVDEDFGRQVASGKARLADAASDLLEAVRPLTSASVETAAHFAAMDPDDVVTITLPVRCILLADAALAKATGADQ